MLFFLSGKMLSVTATNSKVKKTKRNPTRMSPNDKALKVTKGVQFSQLPSQIEEDFEEEGEEYHTASSTVSYKVTGVARGFY